MKTKASAKSIEMTGDQIRRLFLDYFRERGHTEVESSSLIPEADPSLLFANAGMNQFKEIFLGVQKADYPRAASCQKCVRAGGKHNDLENVGHTARHHTFFEMLGNFSFGDYFKKEACLFAWEFLTRRVGLPVEKLWVTVYQDDDEAAGIWEKEVGVAHDRIVRLGEKDNFWSMGEIGPCGPCSEIMFDQGAEISCGKADCKVGCDCDRYLEIWNLVFMQYDRNREGKLTPLPKPSIDTGMGLERITAVKQGVKSNFDCDLFAPLISCITGMAKNYSRPSVNVIADHIRAAAFLITDGALPGNEGRGYVLRRIIRRAIRHGRMLGIPGPVFYKLPETLTRHLKDQYPGLVENIHFVSSILLNEEERFASTLEKGLRELDEIQAGARQDDRQEIPGNQLFKLYDTYGFPLDLAREILEDNGFFIDRAGYELAMEEQRKRARSAWKAGDKTTPDRVYQELGDKTPDTFFTGYAQAEGEATIVAIIAGGESVTEVSHNTSVEIVIDKTPFYAQSGGQVADIGKLSFNTALFEVDDVKTKINRIYFHSGKLLKGKVKVGDLVKAEVDEDNRRKSAANHTATHLLQAALRKVLGNRVKQAGSAVSAGRLRFDFTHIKPVIEQELKQIQDIVNRQIVRNTKVETEVMPLAEAMKREDLMALFEDKYQSSVRVVSIPGFSAELCGGIHAGRTGDLGLFKILSEGGVAAGIRRIEAITEEAAYLAADEESRLLEKISSQLKATPEELPDKLEKLLKQLKDREKEISKLHDKLAAQETKEVKPEEINGISYITKVLSEGTDMGGLMKFSDALKNRPGKTITCVASASNGKANLVMTVSHELSSEFPAGKCVKEIISPVLGGGGGGRPEMAKAGGGDPAKIQAAFEAVKWSIVNL